MPSSVSSSVVPALVQPGSSGHHGGPFAGVFVLLKYNSPFHNAKILLHSHGFRQIPRLVDIAAAADGDVVRQ